MKSALPFKAGGWFKEPEAAEAVFGYEVAELEQREVGDLYLIPEKEVEVKVVGILERTGTQDDGTIFLPIKTVQKIFGVRELTSIGIKVKKDADMKAFEDKMYKLPDVQVVSLSQVKTTIMTLVSTARVMVFSIALIAILIAMMGVINTVLMSVMERRQEIGILKSMGAMAGDVFKLVWLETIILCISGGLVGTGLALVTARLTDILVRRLLPYSPSGGLVAIDLGPRPDDPRRRHGDRPGQRRLPVLEGGPDAAPRHHPQRGGVVSAPVRPGHRSRAPDEDLPPRPGGDRRRRRRLPPRSRRDRSPRSSDRRDRARRPSSTSSAVSTTRPRAGSRSGAGSSSRTARVSRRPS